jgi:hypothetical protein
MAGSTIAPGEAELNALREGGFTIEEMTKWAQDTREQLRAGGFSDDEIDLNYFGRKLSSNPRPIMQLGQNRMLASTKQPTTVKEALETGFGWGGASLGAQAITGGTLPDKQIGPDTPWHLRLASNIATLVGDAPFLYAGARLGGAPGAFMASGAMRHLFVNAIEHGEIKTKQEFVDLLTSTAWETAKGWITGQAMGFAGRAATVTSSGASAITKMGVPAAAEAATLTTVSRGLEGELPEPQDFIDMALIVFGFRGATAGAAKLRNLWAQTGITPSQIGDDIKRDPKLWQQLVSDKTVPDKYAPLIANGDGTEPNNRFSSAWWNENVRPQLKAAAAKQPEPTGSNEPKVPVTTVMPAPVTEPAPAGAEPPFAKPAQGKEPVLDAAAEAKARAYFERPFSDIPRGIDEPARPPYQNLNYTDTPEAVKQSIDKLAEQFEAEITKARRGVVSNKESYQAAKKVFDELLGEKSVIPGEELAMKTGDYTKLTADVYARKEIATRVAEELLRKREELVAKGANVTDMDRLEWIARVETTGKILAEFAGAKAELGRAMQILQSTRGIKGAAQLEAVKNLLDQYSDGDPRNMDKLNAALDEMKDPAKVLDFARRASKATRWDQFMEAYRASLISGTRTAEVNAMATALNVMWRVPIRSIAAAWGAFHGGEKVTLGETVGATIGMWKGANDAAICTAAFIKHGLITAADQGVGAAGKELVAAMERGSEAVSGKTGGERAAAIPGTAGHVVRAPFLAMALPDLFNKIVAQRAELWALAYRDASLGHEAVEGVEATEDTPAIPAVEARGPLRFGTAEHSQAVADFVNNPPEWAVKQSQAAGLRHTFNEPSGPVSRAFGHFLSKAYPFQMAVPFRRTIGNITKEFAREVPGLNFVVREWRDDFAAGGARRDMALGEVTAGTLLMASMYFLASQGLLTGVGSPDPGQRAVDRAAGWNPYSIKIGDKSVPYQWASPAGQLIGTAVDLYEMKQYMTQDEHDRLLRMIGMSFTNNMTNPSFMQGAVGVAKVAGDAQQYGENYLEQLVGSLVPFSGFLGQMAAEKDPLLRNIQSAFEAVQARIPYWREGIRPKIDIFGEPIKNPEHLWYGSPLIVVPISGDKVRTEASRIGFAAAPIPKSVTAYTGLKGERYIDSIKLTDDQRDIFATEAGRLAHQYLEQYVNAPGWDQTSDLYKRQVYHAVFEGAHKYGALMALNPQERAANEVEAMRRLMQELHQ